MIDSVEDIKEFNKIVADYLDRKTTNGLNPNYVMINRIKKENIFFAYESFTDEILATFNCNIPYRDTKIAFYNLIEKAIQDNNSIIQIISKINSFVKHSSHVNLNSKPECSSNFVTVDVEEEKAFCTLKFDFDGKIFFLTKTDGDTYTLHEKENYAVLVPHSHYLRLLDTNGRIKTDKIVNTLHERLLSIIDQKYEDTHSLKITCTVYKVDKQEEKFYDGSDVEDIMMLYHENTFLSTIKNCLDADVLKYLKRKGIDV